MRARTKIYMLLALGIAALAAATLTFTNVTYWLINATLPPAMKYPGTDTTITARADGSGYDRYVYVSYYYDATTGYNITRISIVGFTGDPTNYTSVLQICNKYYSGNVAVTLQAVGKVGNTGYESYVRDFRVYQSTNAANYVQFQGANVAKQTANLGTIGPNQCTTLGAYVLVDPNAYSQGVANGKTVLATYQVNIVMTPQ